MKKVLKILTCVLCSFIFMFGFTACKSENKNGEVKHDKNKLTPTISVQVNNQIYFAGDNLSTVSLLIDDGSTEGTVVWKNSTETLHAGKQSYSYVFTPTDSKKYSAVTKNVDVFAIAKIYKTATNDFGYKDHNDNYIEFERQGTILSYSSSFAGSGTVAYENEEIVLVKTGGVKNYTITIGESINVFDYSTGDRIVEIGNLNKYTPPAFLGTYTSVVNEKTSTLILELDDGNFVYTLNYNSDMGEGSDSGTYSVNTTTGAITFDSNGVWGSWFGTLNSANNSITVEFSLIIDQIFIKG